MFLSPFSVASLFLISGACHFPYVFVVSLRIRVVFSFSVVLSVSFLLSLSAFPPIFFHVFRSSLYYIYFIFFLFSSLLCFFMGCDSSVDITTRYGLDGPGIESR